MIMVARWNVYILDLQIQQFLLPGNLTRNRTSIPNLPSTVQQPLVRLCCWCERLPTSPPRVED